MTRDTGRRTPRPATPSSPDEDSVRDAGMTLVEVLVAIGLFSVLGSLLLGVALSTSQVGQDVQRVVRLEEDARLAFERITREVRQASRVVVTPDDHLGDGTFGAFNITATFAEPTAAAPNPDPEVLRYEWHAPGGPADPQDGSLTLSRLSPTPDGPAVLATNVVDFAVELRSSRWEFDGKIPAEPADSVSTWQEIDYVNGDNDAPEAAELALIDRLQITMTVDDGTSRRTFQTEVFLRNAEVPQ